MYFALGLVFIVVAQVMYFAIYLAGAIAGFPSKEGTIGYFGNDIVTQPIIVTVLGVILLLIQIIIWAIKREKMKNS